MKSNIKPKFNKRSNKPLEARKQKGTFKAKGGDKPNFRTKNPNKNREAFEQRKNFKAERANKIKARTAKVESDNDSYSEADADADELNDPEFEIEAASESDDAASGSDDAAREDAVEDETSQDIEAGSDTETKVKPKPKALTKEEKAQRNLKATENTIFVGNLPKNLDHHAVAKLFKTCGPVESARIRCIVPDKETLSQKVALRTGRLHPKVDCVNAYVVFKTNENDECIKKALKMNGLKIDGHHIRVDRAGMPKAKKETLTSRKKSVFVGNLKFDIRNDELIDHFNKIGTVDYVRLVRDSATGLGKGFGFVVFKERASVKKALELNETQFRGRSLRIKKIEDEKKPKNKR